MSERSRARRFELVVGPNIIQIHNTQESAWYETPEEIEAGLKWGEEKAKLLKWVRRAMGRKLTLRERRCVELYYFEGLSFREVGRRTGTNASSCCRAITRAVRKLRAASDASRTMAKRRGGRQ